MANYRYQILVDEEGKKVLDAVPKMERSEFIRKVLREHQIRQIEQREPQIPMIPKVRIAI